MSIADVPPLVFKLSTDSEDAHWEHLDSPDDWDYALSRVRDRMARQRGKRNRGVGIRIGFSDLVRRVIQSVAALMLTLLLTLSRGGKRNGLSVKNLVRHERAWTDSPLAANHMAGGVNSFTERILYCIFNKTVYLPDRIEISV